MSKPSWTLTNPASTDAFVGGLPVGPEFKEHLRQNFKNMRDRLAEIIDIIIAHRQQGKPVPPHILEELMFLRGSAGVRSKGPYFQEESCGCRIQNQSCICVCETPSPSWLLDENGEPLLKRIPKGWIYPRYLCG